MNQRSRVIRRCEPERGTFEVDAGIAAKVLRIASQ
jgi:hypothetical protein